MRFVKLLLAFVLAALAVTVGVFAVAALAIGILAYFLGRWTLRKLRGPRTEIAPAAAPRRAAAGDVIDVTATEVRSDSPPLR